MKPSHATIKCVTLVMLVLHLFLPAVAQAHSQMHFHADKLHSSNVICLDADDDRSSHPINDHEHDTTRCLLDTPFDKTHLKSFHVVTVVGKLEPPITGRLLTGYSRSIYIPPRLIT